MTNPDGSPALPTPPLPPVEQPRYGEYSNVGVPLVPYPTQPQPGYQPKPPGYGQQPMVQQPIVRRPRTADIVVTCILLGIGLIASFSALLIGVELSRGLASEYAKYNLEYVPTPGVDGFGAFIAISHVILFLAAAGIAIPLMVRRRLAFYVPLTAGVIATLIFWIVLISLIASDPRLMNAIQASQQG